MSCETEQGRLDFPTCYEGGSLESFSFTIAEEAGAALTDAEIIFRAAGAQTASLALGVGTGLTLTATTAGGWVITVDQIDTITLATGTYYYSLRTTDAGSLKKHYVAGTWQIKDV